MNAPQAETRSEDPIYVYAIVPNEPNRRSSIGGMEAAAAGRRV